MASVSPMRPKQSTSPMDHPSTTFKGDAMQELLSEEFASKPFEPG